jgi:uncharacterized protein YqeY
MFVDTLRAASFTAAKERDTVAKDVLRLAMGEIQNAEVRGATVDDAAAMVIVRKLVKSNLETLAATTDAEQKAKLTRENEVLLALLPSSMDADAIARALEPVAEAIKAAKSDGQAMGVAMKTLKATGGNAEAADVNKAIARIRG